MEGFDFYSQQLWQETRKRRLELRSLDNVHRYFNTEGELIQIREHRE